MILRDKKPSKVVQTSPSKVVQTSVKFLNFLDLEEKAASPLIEQKNKSKLSSNVRRLIKMIQDAMEDALTNSLFEPNDSQTRENITNQIEETLKSSSGIQDYVIVCDETNNTPSSIDENKLYVDVAFMPTRSPDFIYVSGEGASK